MEHNMVTVAVNHATLVEWELRLKRYAEGTFHLHPSHIKAGLFKLADEIAHVYAPSHPKVGGSRTPSPSEVAPGPGKGRPGRHGACSSPGVGALRPRKGGDE